MKTKAYDNYCRSATQWRRKRRCWTSQHLVALSNAMSHAKTLVALKQKRQDIFIIERNGSSTQNLVDGVDACCRSLVFIFNLPHQLCSAFSNLLPGCTSLKTPSSTLKFSIESNLSVHDTHPIPGCLSLPGDVYTTIVEDHVLLSPTVDNNTSTSMREKVEISPVICADHALFTCSIACKSQYLQQFARQQQEDDS